MIQGTIHRFVSNYRFLENINSAYSYANTSLLNLLITTHALPARLHSLKHYFFLDRSDFFTHFLDLANHELKKSSKLISLTKLQSLLDLSLRQPGSVAASDPFKEDVKVQMNDMALTDWLMRIVSVSGLGEDALMSGAVWTEESPVNQDKDSDEKRNITGTTFPNISNVRYKRFTVGLYRSVSVVAGDLEKGGITISIIISSFTCVKTYRTTLGLRMDRSRQNGYLAKPIFSCSSREVEISSLGSTITDVSLYSTIIVFLHQ